MARPKGSLNRSTEDLFDKAAALGVDPFEVLLNFAKRDWKALGYDSPTVTKYCADGGTIEVDVITPDLQLSAAEKASSYLYPKRKAIDVTSHGNGLLDNFMAMDADERKRVIESYATQLSAPKPSTT